MDYNLEVDSTVSFEQAKRIVQKAKNWNSSTDEQANRTPCRYKEKCDDHSSYHRSKYSHPETGSFSSRRNHETERSSPTIRNQETERNNNTNRNEERNYHSQKDDRLQCKYQEKCYDHSENHRFKYSHPRNSASSTQRTYETETNDHRALCKHDTTCYDHSDYHRAKYSHRTIRP